MAKAKEPPLWAPMFSLPNVHVKFPIDVDGFALVAPDDFRIKAIKKQQPRLGSLLHEEVQGIRRQERRIVYPNRNVASSSQSPESIE